MPRRPSTSSTDEDTLEVQWKQESSVVKSVPKHIEVNDYPIFELRDAEVYSSDGTRIVSALEAEIHGPLIVRGYLVIEDAKQKTHLLMRVRKPVPIEIRCVSHSIGETKDKSPLVWLGGRGGWYEINPAESYRPMYSKMCLAITMYYAIFDILSSPKYKKKKGKVEVDELLFEVAVKTGDPCTLEDARLRCTENASFFIYKFLEGVDIDWSTTSFCAWMMKNHQGIVSLVRERVETPLTLGRASAPIAEITASSSARSTRSPSLQAPQQEIPIRQRKATRGSTALRNEAMTVSSSASEDTDTQPQKPARRQTRTRATVISSDSSDDDGPPGRETKIRKLTHPSENEDDQAAFESVLRAVKDTYVKVSSGRGPTYSKLLNTMYNDYTFLRYIPGPQTLQVTEVLHRNAKGLLKELDRHEFEAIYPTLQQFAKQPLEPVTLKDTPFVVRPRNRRHAPSIERASSRSASVQSEVRTPQRAGKSLKSPGRPRSALRPIKTVTRASRTMEINNISSASSSDESDDDMLDTSAGISDLQDSPCPPGQPSPSPLVIVTDRMPSTEGKGLDNTWMCSIDGCDHVVRGGTKANRRKRIQDHLQGHEEGSENDALVDLAVTEAGGNVSIKYDSPALTSHLSSPLPHEAAQSCASPRCDAVEPEPESAPVSSSNMAFLTPAETLRSDFSRMVNGFWREARPVFDKIESLTLLQPPPGKDSQHGRRD